MENIDTESSHESHSDSENGNMDQFEDHSPVDASQVPDSATRVAHMKRVRRIGTGSTSSRITPGAIVDLHRCLLEEALSKSMPHSPFFPLHRLYAIVFNFCLLPEPLRSNVVAEEYDEWKSDHCDNYPYDDGLLHLMSKWIALRKAIEKSGEDIRRNQVSRDEYQKMADSEQLYAAGRIY
ncbi:hypothetical protein ACHAPU_006672 [Fusarium lateritium]